MESNTLKAPQKIQIISPKEKYILQCVKLASE